MKSTDWLKGPRDLVTVLLLRSVSGQDGHLGTCDKHGDKR